MTNKARNTAGKFSAKSDTPRKVRSVNLTDSAWQWLARIAEEAGMSRNDYLEAMADGNTPIMETVETKPEIELDDSVSAALVNAEDAKKNAAFFGFTPDEALADAHFQINMLTSNYDELEDKYEALKHKYSVASPLMETVKSLQKYLEASEAIIRNRNQENTALSARLAGKDGIIAEAAEQVERIESELSNAKLAAQQYHDIALEKIREINELESKIQNLKSELASRPEQESVLIAIELPDAADLLNKLKGKRKKSKADLADLEAIVEILEGEFDG